MNSLTRLVSLCLMLFLMSACTGVVERIVPLVAPTTSPPGQSSFSCPVSPSQTNLRPDLSALAGESPLWLTIGTGRLSWTELPVSLPPYPGRIDKTIWTLEERVKGELHITGKQLNGSGILLFARTAKQQLDERGQVLGGLFDEPPVDSWVIPSAERGSDNSPPGFQDHGVLVYYPHPGCYQYTATIAGRTVQISIDVLDQ